MWSWACCCCLLARCRCKKGISRPTSISASRAPPGTGTSSTWCGWVCMCWSTGCEPCPATTRKRLTALFCCCRQAIRSAVGSPVARRSECTRTAVSTDPPARRARWPSSGLCCRPRGHCAARRTRPTPNWPQWRRTRAAEDISWSRLSRDERPGFHRPAFLAADPGSAGGHAGDGFAGALAGVARSRKAGAASPDRGARPDARHRCPDLAHRRRGACRCGAGPSVASRIRCRRLRAAIGAQRRGPAQAQKVRGAATLVHRAVVLQGRWRPEHTVYLDNRQMQGQVGFFVVTPLQLTGPDAGVLLVQRGWAPRNFQQHSRLPPVQTPGDTVVQVVGRVAPAPSRLYEFQGGDGASSPIRQNLDLAAFRAETGLALANLTVLQTGPASEGLRRDWPAIDTGVDKHYGYAFQWFGLCGLMAVFYFLFQIIPPFIRPPRPPSPPPPHPRPIPTTSPPSPPTPSLNPARR